MRSKIELFDGHPYQSGTFTPNYPNVSTPILRFKVPQGATLFLAPNTKLIAKLRDSTATEVEESAKIIFAKSVAGKEPKPFVEFRYGSYRYLTESEQAQPQNTSVVTRNIGRPVAFGPGEEFVVMLKSALAVDINQSTLTITAYEEDLQ